MSFVGLLWQVFCYYRLRVKLRKHGWHESIAYRFTHTFMSRQLLKIVATDMGHGVAVGPFLRTYDVFGNPNEPMAIVQEE